VETDDFLNSLDHLMEHGTSQNKNNHSTHNDILDPSQW